MANVDPFGRHIIVDPPVVEEEYTNELCFREKIGNVYYYRHQECSTPGYLGYTNVERSECHPAEQCVWCGGLMSEAPIVDA